MKGALVILVSAIIVIAAAITLGVVLGLEKEATSPPLPFFKNNIYDTFDGGTLDSAWNTSYSTDTIPTIVSGVAFLGSGSSMFQPFVATLTTSLSFYYRGDSWDSLPWDSQGIYITDSTGSTIIHTLLEQCTTDDTWINFYCTNIYAPPCNFPISQSGSIVGLMFMTRHDGDANYTHLYIDNVTVGTGSLPAPGPVTRVAPYCKSYQSTLFVGQALPLYGDPLTIMNFDTKKNGNFSSTLATYQFKNTYKNLGGGNGAFDSDCNIIQIGYVNGTYFLNTFNDTSLISSVQVFIPGSLTGDRESNPFYHPNGTLFIAANGVNSRPLLMVMNPLTFTFTPISTPGAIFGDIPPNMAILNNVAYLDVPPGLTYKYDLGTNGPMTLIYDHSVTIPTFWWETNDVFLYCRNGVKHLGFAITRSTGTEIIYFLDTTTITPYYLFPISPSYSDGLVQATWTSCF